MAVSLETLAAAGYEVVGDQATMLLGATHDSRNVEPGTLFCCVPGDQFDGHDFAEAAINGGAAALLVERTLHLGVPEILVDDVRGAMGTIAATIYDNPCNDLSVVGVTGTNGKTTVTQILAAILEHAGRPAATIGTLSGARTTPEAPELQARLATLRDSGVTAVAMEVSSHALELHRVDGCHFAVAVFTNLGRDHLDFHVTETAYFAAKAKLFVADLADVAVINLDDPWGRELAASTDLPTVGYSLSEVADLKHNGTRTTFSWQGESVSLGLAGSHNVSNALAALHAAVLLGLSASEAASGLASLQPPAGRFEFVPTDRAFNVVVDYAHTPDALAASIGAAREVAGSARVIVVFGCGGDRDRDKRSEMGRTVSERADVAIVTSDNPRSEDPVEIIDAVVAGFDADHTPAVEPDRRAAIKRAISEAAAGDVVLIAGKGHETYQVIGSESLPFDDRIVATEALQHLADAAAAGTGETNS